MYNQGIYKDNKMTGPLGQYAIAGSQVQTPGWKPLEGPDTPFEQLTGGGRGGSFGFQLGERPYNDMERTILAHDYPGGFKVATDQYAAKYSDQLDEWALEEMKQKYPKGAATGLSWDEEFARQKKLKDDYQVAVKRGETPQLWGPNGPTGRTENTPNIVKKKIAPTIKTPLGSYRDRDGLSSVFSRNKQNKSAIASRPRSTSDMYSRFGRGR